jgi:hypothetical protein
MNQQDFNALLDELKEIRKAVGGIDKEEIVNRLAPVYRLLKESIEYEDIDLVKKAIGKYTQIISEILNE